MDVGYDDPLRWAAITIQTGLLEQNIDSVATGRGSQKGWVNDSP